MTVKTLVVGVVAAVLTAVLTAVGAVERPAGFATAAAAAGIDVLVYLVPPTESTEDGHRPYGSNRPFRFASS
jgi:hypothetical protein